MDPPDPSGVMEVGDPVLDEVVVQLEPETLVDVGEAEGVLGDEPASNGVESGRPRRVRRAPQWMADYVI